MVPFAARVALQIEGKVNGMYQEEVCVYCAKLYGNEINEIMSLR
jgi:hypothetical protein